MFYSLPFCNILPTYLSSIRPRSNTIIFSSLPLDAILVIMSCCGPKDLLTLRQVCVVFRALLAKNPYVWRLSRANLQFGFPLPVAAPSEEWFLYYVLQCGPCTVCRRPTTELPYSFSLGIRICSAACSWYLLRCAPEDIDECIADDPGVILTKRPENLDELDTLMLQATPHLEWTAEAPLYRPSTIHNGLEELRAAVESNSVVDLESWKKRAAALPFFMEMAETVQRATPGYRKKKAQVEKQNRSLFVALARENRVVNDRFMTSPTLIRHANAFAADLACMTRHGMIAHTVIELALYSLGHNQRGLLEGNDVVVIRNRNPLSHLPGSETEIRVGRSAGA
ncbi:hypothetical protein B0H19DRAFT_1180358 [Mycena capillaripes]|nr:hypothetical protein B0H19DRAFT_1180358 [Mycena capillaripes]